MGRWDYLYDLKPQAAIEVLLGEAAKALAEDLGQWPPPLEGVEASKDGIELLGILQGPRPHRLVYTAALHLTRLDLRREYEDIERWEEEGYKSAQLTVEEKQAAVFLWRYVAERIFDLSEAVRTSISRPQLVSLVDRIEKRLVAPSLVH